MEAVSDFNEGSHFKTALSHPPVNVLAISVQPYSFAQALMSSQQVSISHLLKVNVWDLLLHHLRRPFWPLLTRPAAFTMPGIFPDTPEEGSENESERPS